MIAGKVVCFGTILDPNGSQFGIELTDPADSAAGSLLQTPSVMLSVNGGLEMLAASGPSPVDKFFIVSESVATLGPSQRSQLSNEIFGPFDLGSLAAPAPHSLSAAQVNALLGFQATSSFGGVVFLFHPPGNDVFDVPDFEFFAGMQLSSVP